MSEVGKLLFYVEIRGADNRIAQVLSGYRTRNDAETVAARKRLEIANRGWRMSVYVGEAHTHG